MRVIKKSVEVLKTVTFSDGEVGYDARFCVSGVMPYRDEHVSRTWLMLVSNYARSMSRRDHGTPNEYYETDPYLLVYDPVESRAVGYPRFTSCYSLSQDEQQSIINAVTPCVDAIL